MTDPSYIFLLSSDRSGSNLVLRLLGSHPDVTAPPTSQLIPNLYKAAPIYGGFDRQSSWKLFLEKSTELHRASFGDWTKYADLAKLEHHDDHSVATILRHIFSTECEARDVSNIAVKSHRAYLYTKQLEQDFPTARYIYLTRDPRDMALSWWKTPGLRGGIVRAAKIWREEQSKFMPLVKNLGKACHTLRYEDVLDNPEAELRKLCDFLSLPYDTSMLDFHQTRQTRSLSADVQAWNNLSKPLMKQNREKYRTGLSDRQQAYLEWHCVAEMVKLGYQAEIDPAGYDFEKLESELTAEEPWDKPEYALISSEEKASHSRLREAVSRLLAGPDVS